MQVQIFNNQVRQRIQHISRLVEKEILPLNEAQLNYKAQAESWSLLECLEHLNRYCRYYNAALETALEKAAHSKPQELQTGWLGKKSIASVEIANTKKQKTLKHLDPLGSNLKAGVIQEFLTHQRDLQELLDDALHTDLNKKLVPIEFFKLLKLSTGAAFLFVTAHQERHAIQLQRILQSLPGSPPAAQLPNDKMQRVAV